MSKKVSNCPIMLWGICNCAKHIPTTIKVAYLISWNNCRAERLENLGNGTGFAAKINVKRQLKSINV